jgi:hypothetical protein
MQKEKVKITEFTLYCDKNKTTDFLTEFDLFLKEKLGYHNYSYKWKRGL